MLIIELSVQLKYIKKVFNILISKNTVVYGIYNVIGNLCVVN